jgi:hypothetical protein
MVVNKKKRLLGIINRNCLITLIEKEAWYDMPKDTRIESMELDMIE